MPRKMPNILIFAIDSLRRDHMSCYGYDRLTTPYMDQIAKKGVLFENAFSPYIPTTPAYVSMLTGRDVIATQKVALFSKGPLAEDQPTLPEILKKAGYKSTCIGHSDFYRGFDEYLGFEGWGGGWEERPAPKAGSLNDVAIPVLERLCGGKDPWLLFLRHMDPHSPYMPPPPYDSMFYSKDPCAKSLPDTMKPVLADSCFGHYYKSWLPPGIRDRHFVDAQYDGAVAYMDACIQRIFTRLEELDVQKNTLVVITSDHGETLYDHGCYYDHHGLYEPTLVVPLIFYWPGKLPAGVRPQAYTLQEDLVPTVLDICNLKKFGRDITFDAASVKPYFTDTTGSRRSEFYISECTWMRKQGWRTPDWKFWEALEPDYHHKPPVELYNLIEDPQEENNLAKKESAIVDEMRRRMNQWLDRRCKETGKTNLILDYWLGTDRKLGSANDAKKLQDNKDKKKPGSKKKAAKKRK